MTTKAIEAVARASTIVTDDMVRAACVAYRDCCGSGKSPTLIEMRAAIEAAIASGELVPASAVAAERERCAQIADRAAERDAAWAEEYPDEARICEQRELRATTIAAAIRALEKEEAIKALRSQYEPTSQPSIDRRSTIGDESSSD